MRQPYATVDYIPRKELRIWLLECRLRWLLLNSCRLKHYYGFSDISYPPLYRLICFTVFFIYSCLLQKHLLQCSVPALFLQGCLHQCCFSRVACFSAFSPRLSTSVFFFRVVCFSVVYPCSSVVSLGCLLQFCFLESFASMLFLYSCLLWRCFSHAVCFSVVSLKLKLRLRLKLKLEAKAEARNII